MNFVFENILIIYILPLAFAVFCFALYLLKIEKSEKFLITVSSAVSCVQLVFSSILFYLCNFTLLEIPDISTEWFRVSDSAVFFGVYPDKISTLFLLIFSAVIFAFHCFSFSVQKSTKNTKLVLADVNLINFAVIVLLLSTNALQSLMFIVLISIFSYLYLCIDFSNMNVAKTAKKFLLFNRVADTFLFLSMIILIYFILNYPISEGYELLAYSDLHEIAADFYIYLSDEGFLLTCLLLLFGIFIKTTLFPIHFIFYRISKFSTNLSSLLIPVTLLICGGFFVIRFLSLFSLSQDVMNFIVCFGFVSALLTAIFASANKKPERIIAYAYISNFSFFIALTGLSAVSQALLFFSISILSLSALNLITEIKKNAGFDVSFKNHKYFVCLIVALMAVFAQICLFLGGFGMKNSIFQFILDGQNVIYVVLFALNALLTAFYLFKLLFEIFGQKSHSMVSKTKFSIWLKNGMFFEKLFDFLLENIFDIIANFVKIFDKYIIKRIVNVFGYVARFFSYIVSASQNGNVQSYISYSLFIIGILLIFYTVIAIGIGGAFNG